MTHFPGAPIGSYVCEEGWLIVGDQAWTEGEWLAQVATRPRSATGGHPLQSHCKRGHEFTPENTYSAANGRQCRICKSDYARERYRRQRRRRCAA